MSVLSMLTTPQGKHLVNIFQEAKAAYNEKKNEKKDAMRAEHQKRIAYKTAQNLIQAREETASVASSRHSRRSGRSSRHHKDRAFTSRPPLSHISEGKEGSVASTRRSRSSQPRSRRALSPDGSQYRTPYFEDAPALTRRNTDFAAHGGGLTRTETLPPAYSLHRSVSDPDVRNEKKKDKIDMNLAYGELHHPPSPGTAMKEEELEATMTKLDSLLLEAHCLQHSATAIIANLQANPEAMAAVALTLAELSNILKTMSPAILAGLKASSPAVFALLASPQFLIAGGVALGVTVVMFGGYKIVKQIQANNEAKKVEANRMEEAMVYDGLEMGSIESWRRGIADVEDRSVATSVDGEFITPMAANQKKERIKERAREERRHPKAPESVASERSVRTSKTGKSVRRRDSASDVRVSTFAPRDVPVRSSSSKTAPAKSESGRSERSHSSRHESKGKEVVVMSKEKKKKSSPLSILFKKHKDKKEGEERSSHRPKLIEMA